MWPLNVLSGLQVAKIHLLKQVVILGNSFYTAFAVTREKKKKKEREESMTPRVVFKRQISESCIIFFLKKRERERIAYFKIYLYFGEVLLNVGREGERRPKNCVAWWISLTLREGQTARGGQVGQKSACPPTSLVRALFGVDPHAKTVVRGRNHV